MRGAIAAGHPLTARAGAAVLEQGGSAVDACIAAAFVSWIAESPLTGPGAGGFMLVHRARDQADRLLDCFVSIPGTGIARPAPEMEPVEIRFDRKTTQVFLIGPAACAVPGLVAGLGEAHRLFARFPWRDLIAPAVELARSGVELNRPQAYLHVILDPVLRRDADARRVFGEPAPLAVGDRLRMPDLATTLEQLAEEGPRCFYEGELARRLSTSVREGGGHIMESDLASYRVIRRRPVRAAFRGHEFVSNPPPSSGGLLIAFALRVLDRLGSPHGSFGSAESIAALAGVMREAARVRTGRFVPDLYRGGLPRRLLSEECADDAARRARKPIREVVREPAGLPSTTHVSVLDGDGNAASLSSSTGCGSGVVVPGTGIHLNNMLGEVDLNPGGRAALPGRRLTSMMAPSILLEDGRPRLVIGSAGSERLRGAIFQIVANVVDHGMSVKEAIESRRVHADGETLHIEGGVDPEVARRLEAAGFELVRWRGRNLFFGGVSAVARTGEVLEAAGDLRRGGAGVVVR